VAFEIEIQENQATKKYHKNREDIDHTTIILELENKRNSQVAFAKEMTKC
jgi:predicted FMN-binding regulatory protein PaiB